MTHTKSTAKPPCRPIDSEKTESKPDRHTEKKVIAAKRAADKMHCMRAGRVKGEHAEKAHQ